MENDPVRSPLPHTFFYGFLIQDLQNPKTAIFSSNLDVVCALKEKELMEKEGGEYNLLFLTAQAYRLKTTILFVSK